MEFLLVNHPLDCPICDQGGECDLQDITLVFGSDRSRFYEYEKRAVFDKNVGPFIKMIMTRCIHCTRCIRFLENICDIKDFGIVGRGVMSEISTYIKMSIVHELSANVIDLCPVGALTSLPYAFTARSWELNSLESIDIFDSACSSIRVDYLNNKVMRILPIFNKNINEDWISNKIRFIYDSNVNQRIKYPLINLQNKFINLSWLNAFFLFFAKLYEYAIFSNVSSFYNNLIDVDNLICMKDFFDLIGGDIYIDDLKFFFNFDFVNNVVFDFLLSIENLKIILFVGLNLRTEIPVLNSKLLKYTNIKFFNIGFINSYSLLKIKNLGNNFVDLLKIFSGQNQFNYTLFFNTYLNSSFASHIKYNSVCFFFGRNFYNIVNSFFIFEFCKSFANKFFFNSFVLNLFNSVGIINSLLIGCNVRLLTHLSGFLFLESVDDTMFLNRINNDHFETFVIYRGPFFESGAKMSNLIFPSTTFFEDKNSYFNYFGLLKNAKKVVHNEYGIVQNFYGYLANFYKFYFLNNFCYIKNIFSILKFFDFLQIDFKFVNINNQFVKNILLINTVNYYESSLFSSNIFNFYKSDVYSKNSKNLHLASVDYLKLMNIYS